MLKEQLNREFFTSRMKAFFRHRKSYYAQDVWEDYKGVLWLGYYHGKDFTGATLVSCFADNHAYMPYPGGCYLKMKMNEKVTDSFVQKFNQVGQCAWEHHTYKAVGKTRRQCIRCGKTLVRKTEVVKRKVWVEEDANAPEKKN